MGLCVHSLSSQIYIDQCNFKNTLAEVRSAKWKVRRFQHLSHPPKKNKKKRQQINSCNSMKIAQGKLLTTGKQQPKFHQDKKTENGHIENHRGHFACIALSPHHLIKNHTAPGRTALEER